MKNRRNKKNPYILVVDDERDIRDLISGLLRDEGYDVGVAHDDESTLAAIAERRPSLLLLDVWLEGSRLDGMQLFDIVRAVCPDTPIILISGHGTIEIAVSAIRKGAYDFIEKPFGSDRLIIALRNAMEAHSLKEENIRLREYGDVGGDLIGESAEMQTLRRRIAAAPAESRVMIFGPPGSGKETIARTLHRLSPQGDFPFIGMNCARFNDRDDDRTLAEEALLGVEGGNRRTPRAGLIERAHRGALFLKDVDALPHRIQDLLLRILVEGRYRRLHGRFPLRVEARILSSLSRPPEQAVGELKLRRALCDRLNVTSIEAPPLERRREDIALLIPHFSARLATAGGLPALPFDEDAVALLQTLDWPGNMRQLRNAVEQSLILARAAGAARVSADMIACRNGVGTGIQTRDDLEAGLMADSLKKARSVFERRYLINQIRRFDGNISRVAAFIGMERSALHRKLRALDVDRSIFDPSASGEKGAG